MPGGTGSRWRAFLAALVAAALLFVSRPARADEWWAEDKALHFGVSAGLGAGGYALSSLIWEKPWQRALAGATFSLTFGAAKELWDLAGHGDPSLKDLAWDGIGTGVGVGLALGVDELFFQRGKHGEPSQVSLRMSF
jgi:putative lipoprotein